MDAFLKLNILNVKKNGCKWMQEVYDIEYFF